MRRMGGENESRRQYRSSLNQKRRRERASPPKTSTSHPKVVTRLGFVVKIRDFFTQNGDENRFRRQKQAFLT
ncbi:hypothetical protein NST89_04330 [Caldifermentibacillus hisashii]|uniref:hypothetical protein n=1 Tax=Caldifermentibacillus hisashii TaxID=996558 RepID=UPI0031365551